MFAALSKSVAQFSDPAFRGVLLRAVLASLVVFVALWVGAWFGLGWVEGWLDAWLAQQEVGSFWAEALGWLLSALFLASLLLVSFLLFPATVAVAMSLLLDDIAEAVEQRHYPGLPPARQQPVVEMLLDSLGFVAVTIGINLLALPLYLVFLFIPPLNFFVFYGINGYLLGREYFELVAVRRLDSVSARQLRRRYRGRVFLAGVIIAVLLSVPLLNLVTPIVATGFLVHVFESLRRRQERA
jgi:uncharacterized protein involved in cysteine biosynthesis